LLSISEGTAMRVDKRSSTSVIAAPWRRSTRGGRISRNNSLREDVHCVIEAKRSGGPSGDRGFFGKKRKKLLMAFELHGPESRMVLDREAPTPGVSHLFRGRGPSKGEHSVARNCPFKGACRWVL